MMLLDASYEYRVYIASNIRATAPVAAPAFISDLTSYALG